MSRKYRQRGYQEDEGERRQRQAPRRERGQGPRGRGLGAPTETVFKCARCGSKQPAAAEVAFGAACPQCGADLHTCTNCLHFDTSAPNECRQPVPVRIAKKATRNECELFTAKAAKDFAQDKVDPADPRAAFDALFKL